MDLSTGTTSQAGTSTLESANSEGVCRETNFNDYLFPLSLPLQHITVPTEWAQYVNPTLTSQSTTSFGALASELNRGSVTSGPLLAQVNILTGTKMKSLICPIHDPITERHLLQLPHLSKLHLTCRQFALRAAAIYALKTD